MQIQNSPKIISNEIICPNSYDKLTKVELCQVGVSSNLLIINHLAHMKSYLVIICPNSQDKFAKLKLGQVGVGSNIAQNYSSSPYLPLFWYIYPYLAPIHNFCHYLGLCIYNFPYLAIFTYIYPHLALFITLLTLHHRVKM